jgi:Protein of unknown function (DUF3102)
VSDRLFDYESVPSSVAKFLRGQADRIRRQCTGSVIQIGKALLEAKRHLSHGGFLRWVEAEVGIPARTAQAYMRVANWASGKCATVAHLAPSALYLLSSEGVPKDFVIDIIGRLEAGERIAPSAIREELKAFRLSTQKEHVGKEMCAQPKLYDRTEGIAVADERRLGRAMAEVVTVLMRGLSAADFSRIRDIVTNDAIVFDPRLGQSLKRAFDRETQVWSDARLARSLTN